MAGCEAASAARSAAVDHVVGRAGDVGEVERRVRSGCRRTAAKRGTRPIVAGAGVGAASPAGHATLGAVLPPGVAIDLDGVVWRAAAPIPGAAEAVARLQAAGAEVVFVTNNAYPDLAGHEAKLAAMGIDAAGAGHRRAQAAAAAARRRASGCSSPAAPGVVEAVEACGRVAGGLRRAGGRRRPVDAVVVGFHRDFDYERMRIAGRRGPGRRPAHRHQRRRHLPDRATGLIPGNGAILAGDRRRRRASQPDVAGKPHPPMVDLVRRRCGTDGHRGRRPPRHRRALRPGPRLGLRPRAQRRHRASTSCPSCPTPDLVAADLAAAGRRCSSA